MRHRTRHVGTQPRTDRCPECKDRHRHRTPVGRKTVRYDSGRRRSTARFAHPHTDTAQQELKVSARYPAYRREAGPDDKRGCENVAAVGAVRKPRDRNAEHHIEKRQRNTGEKSNAAVSEMQLQADRFQHGRYDVAIRNVDGVDQAHHDENVPAFNRRRSLCTRYVECRGAQSEWRLDLVSPLHHTGFVSVARRRLGTPTALKKIWADREMA